MKKFFITFIMLLMPVVVFAGGDDLYYYDDSNETYVVQCSYSNTKKNGKDLIEIHYYHNKSSDNYGKWGIWYEGTDKGTKGPDWFGNIFSDKGSPNIYMQDAVYNALKENHTCPGICYLDTNARNEICCDNNDGWCIKNHTDAGTYFGEANKKFESGQKESDKQEDVAQKIEDNMNNNITDDTIEAGQEAVQNQINQNINGVLDEEYNVNNGGEISDADKNYYENHQQEITDTPRKELLDMVSKLENLLEKDYQNGLIDEDTYNEKKQVLDTFSEDDINKLYDNVFDYNLAINPVILDQTCKSMLGDPQTEGTPAFYLIIAFTVMKYVAIILLIVLSIMDFATATASHDNDMIKKATSKAIKRALLCLVIFLLPTLIEFVLKYINERAVGLCGIK